MKLCLSLQGCLIVSNNDAIESLMTLICLHLKECMFPLKEKVSLQTVYFIVLLQSHMLTTALISLSRHVRGIVSREAVEREIHSTSVAEKSIPDCDFDLHVIGQVAHVVTNPFLECTDAGSLAHDLSKPPAKSASTKNSNPLPTSSARVRPSSNVPSKHFPIRLVKNVLCRQISIVK